MIDPAPTAPGPTSPGGVHVHAAPARVRDPRASWRAVYWLIGFACLLIIAVPLFWIYWMAASIQGTELDCSTWQVRSFQFLCDPFTGTQITAIRHDTVGQFALDPVIAAYLTPSLLPKPRSRWDLVAMRSGAQVRAGEAVILLKYLQASDPEAGNTWVQWTNDHAKHAAVFWPAVRDAVLLERYDALPLFFDSVRSQPTPDGLKAYLANLVSQLANEQAQTLRLAGDLSGAQQLEQLGLSYVDSESKGAPLRNVESTK